MASDRPYRRALSLPEIIIELRRMQGTQFDPAIAEIFAVILEREGEHLVVNSAYDAAQHALRWHPATAEYNGVNDDITRMFSVPELHVAQS